MLRTKVLTTKIYFFLFFCDTKDMPTYLVLILGKDSKKVTSNGGLEVSQGLESPLLTSN